jgi:hypothetical protein
MAKDDYFIQHATSEHKGKFHKFAEEHDALTKRGTIDLPKAKKAIDRLPEGKLKLTREREYNLAKNLQRLRNR